VQLELKKIRCDGGTQTRARIYDSVVEEYAHEMGEGDKFPPLVVFHDGKEYWLADGFHRYRAALSLNLDRIECEIRPGTLTDAQWYSFSANKSNGMRRTNDDKERALKAALRHSPGRSDREIARHIGVSHTMVAKYREEMQASGELKPPVGEDASGKDCQIDNTAEAPAPKPTRVVTRNGKTYPMKTGKIGSGSKAKKLGGVAKNAAVPTRKPTEMIPTLTLSLPMNNPDAAGRALLSNCKPAYLRAMIETIVTVLKERNL
jgi:hypothetical protein